MTAPGSRAALGSLVLAIALLAAAATLVVVATRGPGEPRTMDERVRAVASTLRCPVCQNLSVADSPSRLAQEFRASIERDLRAGRTPDQIRQRFVDAYGLWILESPPKEGIDLVAWIGPLLLVLGGIAAAAFVVRRWTAGGPTARGLEADSAGADHAVDDLAPEDRDRLERALAAGGDELE